MDWQDWALVFSFVAMLLIASGYFVKKKSAFLLFQAAGLFFLMISYLCNGQYFAMVGLAIALIRLLIYYVHERKEMDVSIWLCLGLCAVSLLAYGVVNLWILKSFHPADILYLIALITYMFVFRIRNIKTVRFAILLPTAMSIVYNLWAAAPVFAVISYCFEMSANVTSILKYHVFGRAQDEKTSEE